MLCVLVYIMSICNFWCQLKFVIIYQSLCFSGSPRCVCKHVLPSLMNSDTLEPVIINLSPMWLCRHDFPECCIRLRYSLHLQIVFLTGSLKHHFQIQTLNLYKRRGGRGGGRMNLPLNLYDRGRSTVCGKRWREQSSGRGRRVVAEWRRSCARRVKVKLRRWSRGPTRKIKKKGDMLPARS